MSEEKKQIWYHSELDEVTFYSIPENVFFLPGEYEMERFDGVVKKVQSAELINYQIESEEAGRQLKESYEAAMQVAKKKLGQLARFAELTGKSEQLNKIIDNGAIPSGAQDVQEFVQDFFSKMNQTTSSEVEQQKLFKETFQKVPEIAAFFDEKTLEKAANDPETWANEMYQTMFGEEEVLRQKKKTEKLKNTIAEQLRRNIEEAENKNRK